MIKRLTVFLSLWIIPFAFAMFPLKASAACEGSTAYFAGADAALNKTESISGSDLQSIKTRTKLIGNASRSLDDATKEWGSKFGCPNMGERESHVARLLWSSILLENDLDLLLKVSPVSGDCRELAFLQRNYNISHAYYYMPGPSTEDEETSVRQHISLVIKDAAYHSKVELPPDDDKNAKEEFMKNQQEKYQTFKATMTSPCFLDKIKLPKALIIILFGDDS